MGYGTRPGTLGHTIQTFWPDDDDNTIYIDGNHSRTLAEIQQTITDRWPDESVENIIISSDKIQTDCLDMTYMIRWIIPISLSFNNFLEHD